MVTPEREAATLASKDRVKQRDRQLRAACAAQTTQPASAAV